jgi:hypothetical protein
MQNRLGVERMNTAPYFNDTYPGGITIVGACRTILVEKCGCQLLMESFELGIAVEDCRVTRGNHDVDVVRSFVQVTPEV